jgi:hypothetical protein
MNCLDRQHIVSQWGLQLIFRMHNSGPTPQGVENRNILLWFKCVLTALHVNCMILGAKGETLYNLLKGDVNFKDPQIQIHSSTFLHFYTYYTYVYFK